MYKVMIVEDDPMVAAINRGYLENHGGIQIAGVFGNGQDALNYLREYPVDLAVVDYYMPVVNGCEFINRCREENILLDIIMITANNNAKEIAEIMRLGVVDYLIKPFTCERFSQAIQKFLDRKTAFQSGKQLSQEELDKLLPIGHSDRPKGDMLDKGLQQKTLELVLSFLEQNKHTYHSSEEIAAAVGLSRITIRRYMNYLLRENEITSQADYTTGGRPSIRYRKR